MLKNKAALLIVGIMGIISLLLPACTPGGTSADNKRLEIVATTTFVGETVARIAGDLPQLTILLEPGQNPHSYQPSPQDLVRISEADLIFSNGFGLEEFLINLLAGGDKSGELIEVSEGIEPLLLEMPGQQGEGHEVIDPHVWFDPNNIIVWTENISAALIAADPVHADTYRENAASYQAELEGLDSWIREQVASIPLEDRQLVTDHAAFGYFAEEYGFEQVGAVISAPTTEAETSGQELAGLMETIRDRHVKAIFVSVDIDPTLAEIVAEDTAIELVPLYFGSLTEGGPADTYLDFMHYNVDAIVEALGK